MPTDTEPRAGRPPRGDYRRVTVVPDGPLLVEGPVEIVLPDGATLRSDRFVVALCQCRRSKRYPLCDTSHRRRLRREPEPRRTGD